MLDRALVVVGLLLSILAVPSLAAASAPAEPAPEWQTWFCLVLMIGVVLMLMLDIAPVTSVMFGSTLILLLAGIITMADFISGLSTTSIVTIAHLFIVVDPLANLPGTKKLIRLCLQGGSRFGQWFQVLKLSLVAMVLSAFCNQNPIIVLMTPIVKQYCRDHGFAPSQFLMPMAFASALGGSWTLIGTSVNLTYNGLMQNAGMGSMPFFELIRTTGIPSLFGLLYCIIVPPFLLPKTSGGMFRLMREKANDFMAQFVVTELSPLVGHTLADIDRLMPADLKKNANIIEITRAGGDTLAPPRHSDIFCVNDTIVFTGPVGALRSCAQLLHLNWVPTQTQSEMANVATPSGEGHDPAITSPTVDSGVPTGSFAANIVQLQSQGTPHLAAANAMRARANSLHETPTVPSSNDPFARPTPLMVHDFNNASFGHTNARDVDAAVLTVERPDFIELVLSYRCPVLGCTVGSGRFQSQYDLSILALRKCHGSEDFTAESKMSQQQLQQGDTLLVFGLPSVAERHEADFSLVSFATSNDDEQTKAMTRHYINVPHWFPFGQYIGEAKSVAPPSVSGHTSEETTSEAPSTVPQQKAIRIPWWYPYSSVLIFALMVGFTIGGYDIFLTSACAVGGTVLLKLLTARQAVDAIDFNVMIMIVYSFGLGAGMTKSGLAAKIGNILVNAHVDGFKLLLLIAAVATVVTSAITNKACAQVLFPIVVSIYRGMNKNPLPAAMLLCACSSWAFSTPYGKPTNLVIMGPGGYKAVDYAKMGIPLNLFMTVLISISVAIVYGEW